MSLSEDSNFNKQNGFNKQNRQCLLGFGCMRLPGDFEKSERLILHAIKNGVDYFDTAYIYPGKEVLLGKILAKNKVRDRVKIATKLPIMLVKSAEDFDNFFNKQLSRLQTDYIDCYMLHMLVNPAQLQGLIDMGLNDWVNKKKQSGEIREFGFSFHGSPNDFIKLIDCGTITQSRQCLWDFVMIQYNYLDTHCQAGIDGLRYAHSKGIPVIVMEPLRGGTLANPKQIPKKAMKVFGSRNPAELALKWLKNHEEISCILSGMRNKSDLESNLAAIDGEITEEELEIIDEVTAIFREQNSINCTGCNYCLPCPVGVNIPGCFFAYNAKSLREYAMNTGALFSKSTAAACVNCGKCEPKCPQAIAIGESLKKVKRRMEPFWIRWGFSLARKFTSKRRKKK